jgi:hypothetical protein
MERTIRPRRRRRRRGAEESDGRGKLGALMSANGRVIRHSQGLYSIRIEETALKLMS